MSALAGAQFVPYNLFGSPLNAAADVGDVVVPTASATADPGRGKVFECRYDSAATSFRTQLRELLRIADPVERRRELGGAFFASPCYHGNLMRHVELTNEVLGELTEWTSARAPRVTLGGYGPITLGMDEQAAVAAGSLKLERAPYCSLPGVASGTLYSMPAATDPRIQVVTDAGKVVRIRARGAWTTDFGVSRGENAEALARRSRAAGWTVTISGESSAFGPGIVEASKGAATFTVYADEAGNVGDIVDIPRPVYCD